MLRRVTRMGEPLNIDWQSVKQDRAKGMDYKSLAKKYGGTEGAIKMKANRQGWATPAMSQAAAVVDRVVPKGHTLARVRENVAAHTQKVLFGAVEKLVMTSVTQAQDIMSKSHERVLQASEAKELADAARAWEIGHNGARKALGLDRPDPGNSGQQWAMQPASVIDVEAVEESAMHPNAPDDAAEHHESLGNQDINT